VPGGGVIEGERDTILSVLGVQKGMLRFAIHPSRPEGLGRVLIPSTRQEGEGHHRINIGMIKREGRRV
jgi:hypothetical protein